MRRLLISSVAAVAVLSGAPAFAQAPQTQAPAAQTQNEDARLNAFFEEAFQARIALSPQQMTALGIKTDYDKLDDVSDAAADRALALQEAQLARMKAEFDPEALSPQARLSWRMFEYGVDQARLSNRWRNWGFQFTAPVFVAGTARPAHPPVRRPRARDARDRRCRGRRQAHHPTTYGLGSRGAGDGGRGSRLPRRDGPCGARRRGRTSAAVQSGPLACTSSTRAQPSMERPLSR